MRPSVNTSPEKVLKPSSLDRVVTILDVAREAGVSKSTVSRVLDERLPRSSSATAERVRQVAAELGYVRDPLASGLRRAGTSTVGVIVPRLTDTVMAMLYEEIAAASASRELTLSSPPPRTSPKPNASPCSRYCVAGSTA
jgi:LacI family transcriptional regulator